MDNADNKNKLEVILKKYDEKIRGIYTGITRLEGNATLKKSDRRSKMKDLIVKEANKNVD